MDKNHNSPGHSILTTSNRVTLWHGAIDPIESEAAMIFAVAWNQMDPKILEPILDDDVVYESQNVIEPLVGKSELMRYLKGKMKTIEKAGNASKVFAELGTDPGSRPCVLLAQGGKDNLEVLVLFKIRNNKVSRIDLCTVVPHPSQARRTGDYPREVT